MITPDTRPLRRSVLLGVASLAFAACGRREPPPAAPEPALATGPPPTPVEPAAAPPPPGAPVVTVLGDSITAGLGVTEAQALPSQLGRALAALGVPAQVRAAGVSGDTTAGGLARVDFSVQDDSDVCVVALGANDMLQGVAPERVRANLDRIIARLQGRGVTVVLAGMRAPPQYGSYAQDFDRLFADLARERKVAFYPFLLDGVALRQQLNQEDGIHPNPEGVKIIAAGLAPVVAEALRQRERL